MKWLALTVVAILTFVATGLEPELLARNKFLDALVSHELVSILVVVLTVTMASVANVHLALGRLKKSLLQRGLDISKEIAEARTELSENAWYLFGSFCLLIVTLIIKGSVVSDFWLSAAHSVALVILAFNLAVLYDIYVSVYMLTALDEPAHPGQSGEDGSELNSDHE